jgi:hypothetical protein
MIDSLIGRVLDRVLPDSRIAGIEHLLEQDRAARETARALITRY